MPGGRSALRLADDDHPHRRRSAGRGQLHLEDDVLLVIGDDSRQPFLLGREDEAPAGGVAGAEGVLWLAIDHREAEAEKVLKEVSTEPPFSL